VVCGGFPNGQSHFGLIKAIRSLTHSRKRKRAFSRMTIYLSSYLPLITSFLGAVSASRRWRASRVDRAPTCRSQPTCRVSRLHRSITGARSMSATSDGVRRSRMGRCSKRPRGSRGSTILCQRRERPAESPGYGWMMSSTRLPRGGGA
jgi:hypothetical protein